MDVRNCTAEKQLLKQQLRSSADADKPARRVYRPVKVTRHLVPFHILGIVSYCVIVTLSLRCAVFTIFDFKNVVTLKTGLDVHQGYWQYHHSIERIYFLLTFYSNLVALSSVVSEIFNVEKCHDLEIRVRGHSRSLRVVSFDRLCMVSC